MKLTRGQKRYLFYVIVMVLVASFMIIISSINSKKESSPCWFYSPEQQMLFYKNQTGKYNLSDPINLTDVQLSSLILLNETEGEVPYCDGQDNREKE